MSTTPEALAPQIDANVSPPQAQPDGAEQKPGNEAAPSAAVASKTSETIEPETNRLNERFAELTRLRRDAERDRDHWREQAIRFQSQPKPAEPALPQVEKAKTLADFNFDEAQHQAYLVQQSVKAATEAAKRELRAEQEAQRKQRELSEYVSRTRDFAKDKPDFNEVTRDAPISEQVAELVIRAEQGPEIAYHLGKNPDIAVNLNALPPAAAAYELGMLAARLKYERETAIKAKTLLSQAPPPPPKIDGAAPSSGPVKSTDPEAEKMTGDDWAKLRNKELARSRKKA